MMEFVADGAVLPLEKLEAMWLFGGETAESWVSLAWGCPHGKGQGLPSLVLFGDGSSVMAPIPPLERLSLGIRTLPLFLSPVFPRHSSVCLEGFCCCTVPAKI